MTRPVRTFGVRFTEAFRAWLAGLDSGSRARVLARIRHIQQGNFGDAKGLKDGLSELRIAHGPGLRVYYTTRSTDVIVLVGGDKSTQARDVKKARGIAKHIA